MSYFPKPVLLVSKCLGHQNCRWNGTIVECPTLHRLEPFVELMTVCPEVEIGLGTPRDPINVHKMNGELKLLQPSTGCDLTEEMETFSNSFLSNLPFIDGFILKSRSPSCGYKNTKIYYDDDFYRGSGFFAIAAEEFFPNRPIINEGCLEKRHCLENFLTQVYTWARFRKQKESISQISCFHKNNKLLLITHDKDKTKKLEEILERSGTLDIGEYEETLGEIIGKKPKRAGNYLALLYGLKILQDGLTEGQIEDFKLLLEGYKGYEVPLIVCLRQLEKLAATYENHHLLNQTFLRPYPLELTQNLV